MPREMDSFDRQAKAQEVIAEALLTMNVFLETIAVKLQKIETVLQGTKGIFDNRLK